MNIEKIFQKLKDFYHSNKTLMDKVSQSEDPFKVLVACVISQRTKDEITDRIVSSLFKKIKTPYDLQKIDIKDLEKILYPSGFYRIKAKRLKQLSKILIEKYNGEVPNQIEELLKLPQVGRKTANIVITKGYKKPGIAVDTHVHRIVNRIGIVKTKKPEETEFKLREIIPKKYWIELNDYLVNFGKNICTPISPKCSICPIEKYCEKVNVKKFR